MSTGITINFKDGQKFTKDQKHRLGIVVPDEMGDLWTYVQLREDGSFGDVFADAIGATLLSATTGVLTADAAKGTIQLKDLGEFADDEDAWLRGALGYIHAGTALGTAFYVREVIDLDTLEIETLASPTGIVHGGWPVDIPSTTPYSLWMPGLVAKGTLSGITRGVMQAASGLKGEYGFLRQTGWGLVDIDAEGNDLTLGQGVSPVAGGQAAGYAATPTALNVDRRIGRYGFADLVDTTDATVLIQLHIYNRAVSYRFSDDKHAINQVVIA